MKIAPGCKNCYAETLDKRWHKGIHWGPDGNRKPASEAYWKQPHAWNKKAVQYGHRIRVFCASLADVFEDLEQLNEHRTRLFQLIEETPHLQWMLLTKRPGNIQRFIPFTWASKMPDNVEFGYSVCTQDDLETGWPIMASVKNVYDATVFMSMEPMLESIKLGHWSRESLAPDFIIVGGESGHGARPMHPEWVESIHRECQESNILFFFKQWGEHDRDLKRVGKHEAGRLLNGNEYNNLPGPFPLAQ